MITVYNNNIFQEIIATKALDHVLGKKGMNIKSCYSDMYKSHLTIYQEIQNFKYANKGVINGYSTYI